MSFRRPIGRVLDTMSARSATDAVFTNSGQGYNFAISGIPFRVAITDERKYERATADFRKDQFDASASVGDQSLTGWWLRSQLSFHKGAGIKYYEPLDGEEVENRYKDGLGVNPFDPGVVTLYPEFKRKTTNAYEHMAFSGGYFYGLTSGGSLERINASTGLVEAITPATVGNVNDVIVGNGEVYFCVTHKIEKVSGTTGVVVTSNSDATPPDLARIFWAKDRFFITDTNGRWSTVAATASTYSSVDKFWDSGKTFSAWTLAGAPSAVFIGHLNTLYAVSIDPDGTVPVLTSPVVAAEFPLYDDIHGMTYHLGHLVLANNNGPRVCLVQDLQVVFGPTLFDQNPDFTYCYRLHAIGNTVRLVARVNGDATPSVISIDLSHEVTELERAWTRVSALGAAAGSVTTCGAVGDGRSAQGAYDSTGFYQADYTAVPDLAPTATLDTGLIRYGTLEPKKFHTVKVWLGAEDAPGGSVSVSKVMKDGTQVTLYTFDASTATSEDISLKITDPQDYIGLRFTLSRDPLDPTRGPELLGYQLRALPAPLRQRLIRVPLQCYDVERQNPARTSGREGDAWRRLEQLEAAEDSGGLHPYQDFRTGEFGVAYIERIEFENSTPPDQRSSGFGGVVWLTLRKVT